MSDTDSPRVLVRVLTPEDRLLYAETFEPEERWPACVLELGAPPNRIDLSVAAPRTPRED